MNGNIEKLTEEKRNAIINAALFEFSNGGYKNASTNAIVRKAGISKGLLFHYFGSKKGLFMFVYEYALDVVANKLLRELQKEPERDVLRRWGKVALLKIGIIKQYPEIFRFLLRASNDDDAEISDYKKSTNSEFYSLATKGVYDGIDRSCFRDGIDVSCALEIIYWTLEGFSNKKFQQMTANGDTLDDLFMEQAILEMDEYMAVLRKLLYREEYQ